MTSAKVIAQAMTIGKLSKRTGVPIKTLREYERLGFLYIQGRSASNYRLFGDEAVWCVQVTQGLRSLGLTLKQIQELVVWYLERPGETMKPLLDVRLAQAASHVESQIADLQALLQRIHDFQSALAGGQTPDSTAALARLLTADPLRAGALADRRSAARGRASAPLIAPASTVCASQSPASTQSLLLLPRHSCYASLLL